MKILRPLLTAAAALCLLAACGGSLSTAGGGGDKDQADAARRADAIYLDMFSRYPSAPVMKIRGGAHADVYLQSLDIQVEVTGNIASTRYTMVFRNRTNSVLEGELTFPLPDGRAVTRYALDIDGKMREAVPVEKARATAVFEEIQRRQVDPGLLERVEGSNFRTRVYPIPAGGTRTISIGYEEELPLEDGSLYYRLPVDYPFPIEKFKVGATVWNGNRKPLASHTAASCALTGPAKTIPPRLPAIITAPAARWFSRCPRRRTSRRL